MGRDWDYFGHYIPRKPKETRGGIKAQSGRGQFGKSWWAKRWIGVLESFNIGARLGRGRSYARNGQVTSIEIGKGLVKAKVQGTRAAPYKITIEVKVLKPSQWKRLAGILSGKAIFSAKLLAGEMPENIEEAFKAAEISLFPEKLHDLKTDCSCPDWSNPCKHIAAVYYLLGEEFDRDPFLIFKLRGIERGELAAIIGTQESKTDRIDEPSDAAGKSKIPLSGEAKTCEPAKEPLPVESGTFWEGGDIKDPEYGEVSIPQASAALPKRLGNFPFWRGGKGFITALEEIYKQSSPLGMDVFLGDYRGEGKKVEIL